MQQIAHINTETLDYPVPETEVIHPDLWPRTPRANMAPVYAAPQPTYDPVTQYIIEEHPEFIGAGYWEQRWKVVQRFASQAEEDAALLQHLTLSKSAKTSMLTGQYDARVAALAAGYSSFERESWPVQLLEADAYIANPEAATPWLDAASTARGITKNELALRVKVMDTAYRTIHGALTGRKQALWDRIAAAQSLGELEAIDVSAGWDL